MILHVVLLGSVCFFLAYTQNFMAATLYIGRGMMEHPVAHLGHHPNYMHIAHRSLLNSRDFNGRRGCQDAITPGWFSILSLPLIFLRLGLQIAVFTKSGIVAGLFAIVLSEIYLFLVRRYVWPNRFSEHFQRIIASNLIIKRVAFAKKGDLPPAAVIQELMDRFRSFLCESTFLSNMRFWEFDLSRVDLPGF